MRNIYSLILLLSLLSLSSCHRLSKMVASDGATNDFYGASISISGNLVAVGAIKKDGKGGAYLLDCSTYPCQEKSKMLASDGVFNDQFGYSISISGNLVAIGAIGPNSQEGAAYLYDCSTYPCQQKSKLIAPDGVANDHFGCSISISGNLVAVGSLGKTGFKGAAYLYDCSTYPCQQKSKMLASDVGFNDLFGFSISISGNLVAVGAIGPNSQKGAAYLYDCSTYPCQEKSKMLASDGASYDQFGNSISISGNIIAVGAISKDGYKGAAYLYDCSTYPCQEKSKLVASDGAAYDHFGYSISISGNLVAVGAVGPNSQKGAAYLYDCSTYPCQQKSKMVDSDGAAYDHFGSSISISENLIAVGANGQNSSKGGAYLFNPCANACGSGEVCNGFECVSTIPIARFLFDGNTLDSSGNNVSCSIGSSVFSPNFYQRGNPSNQALRLDGNTRITFPVSLNGKFTIEVLFNVQNFTSLYDFISLLPSASSSRTQALFTVSGFFNLKTLWIGGDTKLAIPNVIRVGVTHSLVISVRDGKIVTFIDDTQLGTLDLSVSAGSYTLSIGNEFNGYIDEIGVYSTGIYNPPGNTLNDLTQCINSCPTGKVCVNTPTNFSCI